MYTVDCKTDYHKRRIVNTAVKHVSYTINMILKNTQPVLDLVFFSSASSGTNMYNPAF